MRAGGGVCVCVLAHSSHLNLVGCKKLPNESDNLKKKTTECLLATECLKYLHFHQILWFMCIFVCVSVCLCKDIQYIMTQVGPHRHATGMDWMERGGFGWVVGGGGVGGGVLIFDSCGQGD